MIHLLPYLEEQIISKKAPEDVYMILNSVTDSRKVFLSADAEFIGQVNPLDFKIVPKINYRNSFLPVLTGDMTKNAAGGTTLDITLQMHLLTRIFMSFWFGMVGFCFLSGTLAVFTGVLEEITPIFVLLGFIISGQILVRCGFNSPARKALKRLKELLC